VTPIPSFIFLGLSYAIYGVVIWPSVAIGNIIRANNIVAQHEEDLIKMNNGPEIKLVGTAFGISTASLNMSLTILPIISAYTRVRFNSFTHVEIFFASLAAVAAFFCSVLYYNDMKNESCLQRSGKEIEEN
jgi:hypothetical protein